MNSERRLRDRNDSAEPAQWFKHGADRLRGVEVVSQHTQNVSSALIAMLHHGVELYLKGYLLARGWQQEKTKSLVKLFKAAEHLDSRFSAFLEIFTELNRDFRLANYPGGDWRKVSDHFAIHQQKANELVALIRQRLPHFFKT